MFKVDPESVERLGPHRPNFGNRVVQTWSKPGQVRPTSPEIWERSTPKLNTSKPMPVEPLQICSETGQCPFSRSSRIKQVQGKFARAMATKQRHCQMSAQVMVRNSRFAQQPEQGQNTETQGCRTKKHTIRRHALRPPSPCAEHRVLLQGHGVGPGGRLGVLVVRVVLGWGPPEGHTTGGGRTQTLETVSRAMARAPGPDGLPLEALQAGGPPFIERLADVCVASVKDGAPARWKGGSMVPVPRKASRQLGAGQRAGRPSLQLRRQARRGRPACAGRATARRRRRPSSSRRRGTRWHGGPRLPHTSSPLARKGRGVPHGHPLCRHPWRLLQRGGRAPHQSHNAFSFLFSHRRAAAPKRGPVDDTNHDMSMRIINDRGNNAGTGHGRDHGDH